LILKALLDDLACLNRLLDAELEPFRRNIEAVAVGETRARGASARRAFPSCPQRGAILAYGARHRPHAEEPHAPWARA
jgi:hypothetical protein